MYLSWPLWYLSVFNVSFYFFFFASGWKRWGMLKAMPIRITFPDFFLRSSLTLMDCSTPYQDWVAQLEQKMPKLQRKLWLWQHYRQDNLLFMIYLGCSALNRIPETSCRDVVFFNCSSQFFIFWDRTVFNFFLQFNQSSDFQVCIYLLNWTLGPFAVFWSKLGCMETFSQRPEEYFYSWSL